MIFVSAEDFFEKVAKIPPLTRTEELECARRMGQGDPTGRERLIEGYLPMVAGRVKRLPKHMQTLGMILYCMHELEKAVDGFNFLQDREPFVHRLSWSMRQAVTKYIAK